MEKTDFPSAPPLADVPLSSSNMMGEGLHSGASQQGPMPDQGRAFSHAPVVPPGVAMTGAAPASIDASVGLLNNNHFDNLAREASAPAAPPFHPGSTQATPASHMPPPAVSAPVPHGSGVPHPPALVPQMGPASQYASSPGPAMLSPAGVYPPQYQGAAPDPNMMPHAAPDPNIPNMMPHAAPDPNMMPHAAPDPNIPNMRPHAAPAMPTGGAMMPVASSQYGMPSSDPGMVSMYGQPQTMDEYGMTSSGDADIVIPRILIEAFFERPAVQSTIAVAAGDRRMSDASVEIIPGGLPAAIARYAHQPNPNVIIVESSLPGPQVVAQLDNLANLCDENVKVMVVGVTNDVELYRELMRRGVSEYLVPPFQPLQLIRAIAGLVVDPDAPFSGKCIAVCGVKGGVGASTLAHNLAWACSERIQMATTLVDFDLNFGTASLNFNQDKLQSIADALASPDRFDTSVVSRMATKITDHLLLLNAPSTLDSGFEFEPAAYKTVINEIRKTVPLIIMDMPTNWSEATRAPLIMADEVIVVSTPELASLRNAKNMVDFLVAKRPNDSPPHLVLNMAGVPGRPEISEKEFVSALGMSPIAIIQFEPRLFGIAANSGRMLAAVSPEARCVRTLDSLATLLTGRELKRSAGGMGAFIGRLLAPAK